MNRNRRLGVGRPRMVNEHFKVDGRPKQPFEERIDAEEAAEKYSAARTYRCKFCDKYHIGGHKKPKKR